MHSLNSVLERLERLLEEEWEDDDPPQQAVETGRHTAGLERNGHAPDSYRLAIRLEFFDPDVLSDLQWWVHGMLEDLEYDLRVSSDYDALAHLTYTLEGDPVALTVVSKYMCRAERLFAAVTDAIVTVNGRPVGSTPPSHG